MDAEQERHALDALARRVEEGYVDGPVAWVKAVVGASYRDLSDKPVRDFIPVLVEHEAKARLRTDRTDGSDTR